MPRRTDLAPLLRSAERQRRALARTQLKLAAATHPEDGAHIVDPGWDWAHKLVADRGPQILEAPNTLGYALGNRYRKNLPTDEPVLTVFVQKKLTPKQLRQHGVKALGRSVKSGKHSLGVDVIELGRLKRYGTLGRSVGPRTPRESGTLGALAIDKFTNRPVALTAMHVSGLDEIPQSRVPLVQVFVPSVGQSGSALYGNIVAGSMKGIDGCKIELRDPRGTVARIPLIGEVRGWRPVRTPGDRNLPVRMFGAVSQLQTGFIHTPLVALPRFRLNAAILVQMSAQHGDSGAALLDEHNLVLGTLVGQAGPFQVFCAIGEVLTRLFCDIPTLRN